jgi:HSP20 family protein
MAASSDQGVLTLRIPVAEQAKPRKVEITAGTDAQPANSTSG